METTKPHESGREGKEIMQPIRRRQNCARAVAAVGFTAPAVMTMLLPAVAGATVEETPSKPKPLSRRRSAVGTVSSPSMKAAPTSPAPAAADPVQAEPTLTSGLAGVSLKTRAARITDVETVEALVRPLRQLAAAQGASLGSVEVLGWGAGAPDKAFPDARAQAVMVELQSALKTAGYDYAAPGEARKRGVTSVTLLTATRGTTGHGARLMGFWIKTERALLLAWGRVEPSLDGPDAMDGTEGSDSKPAKPEYNPALTAIRDEKNATAV
jgi:hypothetical protein